MHIYIYIIYIYIYVCTDIECEMFSFLLPQILLYSNTCVSTNDLKL